MKPWVEVTLWGSLRALAGGEERVRLQAAHFKDILDELTRLHPGLAPQIKRGVSVSVDGVIYRDAWFTPVSEESEIVLLPYLEGG